MKKFFIISMSILPVVAFVIIYTYFAYNPEKSMNYNSSTEETTGNVSINEVTLPLPTLIGGNGEIYAVPTDHSGRINISTKRLYMLLPVKHINQNPELPTGCEITSLTMVLNYLGFDIDKITLADNFLDKLETPDGSFYDFFIGDPKLPNGMGCFAPAITNAANKYLKTTDSELKASNISGSTLQAFFDELSDGNPIIIWTSSNLSMPVKYTPINLNTNSVFNWPNNEHCVVLIGYNLEKNIVYLADPLKDIIECDLNVFSKSYEDYYKQAVVIK